MTVPPPGRLSTTTCCPHSSPSFAAIGRTTASVAPPACNGDMSLTGRGGLKAPPTCPRARTDGPLPAPADVRPGRAAPAEVSGGPEGAPPRRQGPPRSPGGRQRGQAAEQRTAVQVAG